MSRPLVAIPSRFARQTSALRYSAAVNALALLTMVHEAGGEPVSILPWPDGDDLTDDQLSERLDFVDAVLLPGGGDLDPSRYREHVASEHVYDVDPLQDHVDLRFADWALTHGLPLFAVCRGLHVVNVTLGGTLEQHMEQPHREVITNEVRHRLAAQPVGWPTGVDAPETLTVSCYHHQRIATLGQGLRVLATAGDGTIEAVSRPAGSGWFLGVQWHPEDMPNDEQQRAIVGAFVSAARGSPS